MNLTRVYLAARYSRRAELCDYRGDLHRTGLFEVTSRWLDGEHQISDTGLAALGVTSDPTGSLPDAILGQAGEALVEDHTNDSEDAVALRTRFAMEDWADLAQSDVVVSFTETPRASAALALGKRCLVVGPRENVFHCLPGVDVHEHWWQALADVLVAEVARRRDATRAQEVAR